MGLCRFSVPLSHTGLFSRIMVGMERGADVRDGGGGRIPFGLLFLLCHKFLKVPLLRIYGWALSFMEVEDGSFPGHG